MKVLVLGYGPMGLALVRGTLAYGNNVQLVGVFPWSNLPKKRHQTLERCETEFQTFIRKLSLPLIQCDSVNSYAFVSLLTALKPDVVLVGSWGEIFQATVLNQAGTVFINAHPSLLPHHRGANPYTAAILAGDTRTGVTLHLMDESIDTGPIVMQQALDIYPDETGISLRERCAQTVESMVPRLLEQVAEGRLNPVPQLPGGSYDKLNPNTVGWLDWTLPPQLLSRQIRALYPWIRTYGQLRNDVIGFRFGKLVAVDNRPKEPGIILNRSQNTVVVSTCEPGTAVCFEEPHFYHHPPFLTPVLSALKLKAGRQFLLSDSTVLPM